MTGGWAAKELTEKGLKTLVLEAGRPIVPEQDYVEHVPPWEMQFRGMRDRRRQLEDQPIQSTCYACDEWSAKFFVSDKEHPYTTRPGKPFRWIRGRQVGGRSIVWGRQVYRWSDLGFRSQSARRNRDRLADPLRRCRALVRLRRGFHRHHGRGSGPPAIARQQVPSADGTELRGVGGPRRDCETFWRGARSDHRARGHSHSGPSRPRRLPLLRSMRERMHHAIVLQQRKCDPAGCREDRTDDAPTAQCGAQPQSSTPAREERPECASSTPGLALHWSFAPRRSFLCASALESVRILFNSSTPEFPNGLANSSGELGHNLMDHVKTGGAIGDHPRQ